MPMPVETRLSNSRMGTTATLMRCSSLPALVPRPTVCQIPAGVTESLVQDTLIAQFNEIGSISIHSDEYPNSIACVIVEPVAGNMGIVPPEDEFLEGLREITTGCGVSLILTKLSRDSA